MKNLKIAAVQTRPLFGEVAVNVETALDLVPDGMDLVVLPELFATGYQFRNVDELADLAEDLKGDPDPSSALGRLVAAAADSHATYVAGLAERDGDRFFNSAVLVRPDGSRETYRKVHLFMDEKSLFAPGDLGFPVFGACGTTVGMMICFDWIFPEAARSLALAGAEILCHPSNLLLPWCQDAMVTRCRENMVHAVTANRVGTEHRTDQALVFSGRSQIVSPRGERLAALDAEEIGAARAAVDLVEKDKVFTPRNDLWTDRRPDCYRL